MNTLMHRPAGFLPRPLVEGLSFMSRDFSVSNPLVWPIKGSVELREYDRAYRMRRRREDETYREAVRKRNYELFKKKMLDPSWHRATMKSQRILHRQYYQDKEKAGKIRFRTWLIHKGGKLREGLVWKAHVPILYKDKVTHTCVGCGYPPWRGLKLWWQQISDPSLFRCHSCYCSPKISEAMPVGYEDMDFSPRTNSPPHPSSAEDSTSLLSSGDIKSDVHGAKENAEDEKKSS